MPGPMAQCNAEIDQLLIGSMLNVSGLHEKHHVSFRGLMRFLLQGKQDKEIIK